MFPGVVAAGRNPVFQASMLLGVLAVGFALRDPEARPGSMRGQSSVQDFAIYLATQAVATVGSVDRAASFEGMHRFFLDCVFVMILLMLVQMTGRPWTVAAVIVLPLAVLSVLTVINELVYGGTVSSAGSPR